LGQYAAQLNFHLADDIEDRFHLSSLRVHLYLELIFGDFQLRLNLLQLIDKCP
jgi:hypothetical protein